MIALHATPATPALSCARLLCDEFVRRVDLADDRAEELAEKHNGSAAKYGEEIIWHLSFPKAFVELVTMTPLQEVVSILDGDCPWSNWGDTPELGLVDYCYLADILRDALADKITAQAHLRLSRALAWVEETGTVLLAEQAVLTPVASATNAPLMTASAA
ncbi:hypothetical protein [Hymenobacter bucti]|uniref:Uncharacterized protein n=1 Tax=Hymenobacter bucti TaxID=1844114 RepID=A0ABW4QXZ9_9BACT